VGLGRGRGTSEGERNRSDHPDDIEAKLRAIVDDIEPVGEQAKGGLMAAAPVVASSSSSAPTSSGSGREEAPGRHRNPPL